MEVIGNGIFFRETSSPWDILSGEKLSGKFRRGIKTRRTFIIILVVVVVVIAAVVNVIIIIIFIKYNDII